MKRQNVTIHRGRGLKSIVIDYPEDRTQPPRVTFLPPIETEEEYRSTLKRINALMHVKRHDKSERAELDAQARRVEAYEAVHYPC